MDKFLMKNIRTNTKSLFGLLKTQKKQTKRKFFRIAAKKVYLTYSKVPESLQSKEILDQLKKNVGYDNYLIAKEQHKDGTNNFHVLLNKKNKVCVTTPDMLDVEWAGERIHGNYQPVRNLSRVAEYVAKSGEYETNFEDFKNGQFESMEEKLIAQVKEKGASVDQVVHNFIKQEAKKALRGLNAANAKKLSTAVQESELHQIKSTEIQEKEKLPVTLKHVDIPPHLEEWMKDRGSTLLLVGPPGTGKTLFCLAFAQEHGLKKLLENQFLKGNVINVQNNFHLHLHLHSHIHNDQERIERNREETQSLHIHNDQERIERNRETIQSILNS